MPSKYFFHHPSQCSQHPVLVLLAQVLHRSVWILKEAGDLDLVAKPLPDFINLLHVPAKLQLKL